MFRDPWAKSPARACSAMIVKLIVVTLLASSLAVVTSSTTPESQASAAAGDCWSGFFQVLSGRLHRLEPTTGEYEAIGPTQPAHYNAMAYNRADGLFYARSGGGYSGIARHELITIDPATGATAGTGLVLRSSHYTADIDPDTGLMWVARGGRDWQIVDLDTLTATDVDDFVSADGSSRPNSADISIIDGIGYGVVGSELVKWDLDARTWERIDVDGLQGYGYTWGSVWTAGGDGLYAANNSSGDVVVFSNITTNNPSAIKLADAQKTNSNDGAACSEADNPFDVEAVDDVVSVSAGFATPIDVLANDTVPSGSLPAATGNGTATGLIVTNPDGTMSYTAPAEEADTTVTFEYELCPGEIASGHAWCDEAIVTVHVQSTVAYPLPSTFRNCATVTAQSAAGEVDDDDCTNVQVRAPLWGRKRSTSGSVPLGDTVDFRFYTRNNGWLEIEDAAMIDEIPEEFEPTQLYTGRWSPSDHEVTFEYRINGSWSALGTFNGVSGAWYNLPRDVDAVRMDFGDLPSRYRTRSESRVRVEAINPDRNNVRYAVPVNTRNCAAWSTSNFPGYNSCANVNIFPPAARPLPAKLVATSEAGPLQEMRFVLTMRNSSGAQRPLLSPYLIDHLPANLEYVSWRPLTTGSAPTLTATDDFGSPGRTLLRWDFNQAFTAGQYYQIELTTRVKANTPANQYLNQAVSSTNRTNHHVECAGDTLTDTLDLDGDGDVAELLCVSDGFFRVNRRALTEARMVVKGEDDLALLNSDTLLEAAPGECPDFDGYTYYPCVAQTRSLGNTDYRLEVENQGNVDLDDFVLYNTLPFVGDTGVWEATLGAQRNSEWRPTLVSPLSVVEVPAGATVDIQYSYSHNPCRPEMSIAGDPPGSEWPLGCVDDWGPEPGTPELLAAVQSVRLQVDFPAGAPFVPADKFVIGYDLQASHGSPFAQEIGWTSFAYTSTQVDGGARNLPSEPRKTGMVIRKPDNGLGDFVWLDEDRDGVQDPGERGINGIEVSLYRYEGGNEVLVEKTTTAYLQGDVNQPGYYFFGDQFPDTYFLVFEAPRVGWNQAIPDQGADDLDSDGAALTMRTPDIVLGEKHIVLDFDQAYFVPGGPLECADGSGSGVAGDDDRRHENDPRPCPM